MKMQTMYKESVKQWNPFVGCKFHCKYCVKSFQRQAKRQRKRCTKCYEYIPHEHPERLTQRLPRTKPGEFIFVCSMGDISFCRLEYYEEIIEVIRRNPDKTFLLQSKNPIVFNAPVTIPKNVILGTTIETNRNTSAISKAPHPFDRYVSMLKLPYDQRKAVTIEPIMQFDTLALASMIRDIAPEVIYIGYDNHNTGLPEPSIEKVEALITILQELLPKTEIRRKRKNPKSTVTINFTCEKCKQSFPIPIATKKFACPNCGENYAKRE